MQADKCPYTHLDSRSVLGLNFFCLILYVPVNSYGHVGTVSSPSNTFFLGKLDKVVNQHLVHILSLVLESVEGGEWP